MYTCQVCIHFPGVFFSLWCSFIWPHFHVFSCYDVTHQTFLHSWHYLKSLLLNNCAAGFTVSLLTHPFSIMHPLLESSPVLFRHECLKEGTHMASVFVWSECVCKWGRSVSSSSCGYQDVRGCWKIKSILLKPGFRLCIQSPVLKTMAWQSRHRLKVRSVIFQSEYFLYFWQGSSHIPEALIKYMLRGEAVVLVAPKLCIPQKFFG